MEEILASIRKIIAEDSSGMRSPPASPRPGAPFTPASRTQPVPSPSAPTPQRGFMSREAFLKSSQPADPEPEVRPVHGLSNPAPSIGAEKPSPSRSRPAEDTRDAGSPAAKAEPRIPSFTPIEKNEFPASEPATKSRNGSASADTSLKSVSIDSITIESISIETVAAQPEPVEQAVVIDAEPIEVHPVMENDTARIEAQLAELINDDLNALRQGRTTPAPDTASQPIVGKTGESAKLLSNAPSESLASSGEPADNVDPFAFDLGPSPFAKSATKVEPQPEVKIEPRIEPKLEAKVEPKVEPKPEPKFESKVEPARTIEAAPLPPSPMTPFEPSRPTARPAYSGPVYSGPTYSGKSEMPANGAANGSHVSHVFESPKSAGFGSSEAPASAPKPRQTFVVPSVSATLGPSRRLEPLSEAFRPSFGLSAPEKTIPTAELAPEPVVQQPVRSPEPVRTAQEPSAAPALRSEFNDSALQAALPPLSNELTTGDRPMEDAVADLLRPLLKTWLAENMPKILERALRREMSERLLPGQKNSRD